MVEQHIELRKFPYPYRAAFSIANDIDNTPSKDIFLSVMAYLNRDKTTPIGLGLGLEIGSSFWFFNREPFTQLCYFNDVNNKETDFAPICRELWKSGHIDILHTYGNYNQGGFCRKDAEISINELYKRNVKILVWTNHGNPLNVQNLGFFADFNGAVQKKVSYHNDILSDYGIRFAWMGKITHILGQNAKNSLSVVLKKHIQNTLFSTRYRRYKPYLYDHKNRLIIETELQDGRKIWDFQRWINAWGRQNILDIFDLCYQLKPRNIETLIKNQGFLILYTHLCEGLNDLSLFPKILKRNLTYISRLFKQGVLLVTTCSRMLEYAELIHLLKFEKIYEEKLTLIRIKPSISVLGRNMELNECRLQGITFYCREPERVRIEFKNRFMTICCNPPDHTGRASVSIPWTRLEYPDI
jgi:hypothetical protein